MRLSKNNNANDTIANLYRVALFGTFDVDNYGDCMFPLIVEHHLKRRLGRVQLFPFSPTNRIPQIGNYLRVYGFSELTEVFSKPPSCFIIGGGELIRTGYSPSLYPNWGKLLYPFSLKTWLLPIMVAKAWNCPSILNAVGMGTVFDEDFNGYAERYLNELALCYVRDSYTAKRFLKLNVKAEVVPDCAFSVSEILESSELANNYDKIASEFNLPQRFIVAQCSLYEYQNAYTNAVGQTSLRLNLPVVLLPICHYASDPESLRVMQKILKKQGVKTYLVNQYLDTIQTSSVLSKSDLFIGTSLHGAIITLSFKKPAISFNPNSESKHHGVLSVVGLEKCYVSRTSEISDRAAMLLQMQRSFFNKNIAQANFHINGYFDKMSEVIKAKKYSSIPKKWNQDSKTGEILYPVIDDFETLNQLCLTKSREINAFKRYLHILVRKNRKIGGSYDRFMFWLRNHKVIPFKCTNMKNID